MPSSPYVPPLPRAFTKSLERWVLITRHMLKELERSGICVNASDNPPPEKLAVSNVLAAASIDMTRAMLLFMALSRGHDVVRLNLELERADDGA